MGRTKNTKIWNYFDHVSLFLACCKLCKAQITCKSSISNLVRHLYALHHFYLSSQGAEQTAFLNYGRRQNQTARPKSKPKQRQKVQRVADENESLTEDVEISDTSEPVEFIIKKVELETTTSMEQQNVDSYTDEQRQCEDEEFSTLCSPTKIKIRSYMPALRSNETKTNQMRSSVATTTVDTNDQHCFSESPALRAKLEAEASYYNELAALAHAKCIMVELQNEKLRAEIDKINDC